jgi:hypothetical protein
MTTIVSAALINATTETEVNIDASTRDITLNLAGNLSATGVTLQALYSYLKKAWRVQDFTITGGSSSGTTVTVANVTNVLPGMAVSVTAGTGTVTAAATVVSIDSPTTFTLSETPSVALSGATVQFVNHLIEYPFPLVAITPEQFEFSYDWTPVDDTSRKLIRTAGWKEISTGNVIQKEFLGVVSLGNIDGAQDGAGGGDQDIPYYAFRTSGTIPYATPIDFTYAGEINEAVQTFQIGGDDNRTKELALFVREEGKTFGKSDTPSIGIATGDTLGAQTFRFPLAEANDLNYTVTDATIEAADGAGEFYDLTAGSNPKISYFATNQLSTTFLAASGNSDLTTPRNFGVLLNANAGDGTSTNASGYLTLQELYSYTKYNLRRAVDIDDEGATDAGVQIGKTSDELLQFVGAELQTLLVQNQDGATTPSGVAIEDFNSTDVGNLAFAYTGGAGALQRFPLISSGVISFNSNLAEDTDATYTMYYQYTRQFSVADLTWTQVSGSTGTLTGSATLPVTTQGDYIDVSGFSDENLNGVYEVTNTGTTSSINVTRIDDLTLPAGPLAQTVGADNFRFNPVNSPDALIVLKADGTTQIRGNVPQVAGGSSVTFDYGFTNDTSPDQAAGENRVSEVDVPISIRASGTTKAQWVQTLGTISTGSANNFSVVAPLERNYAA